jgi:hypothetical protein
MVLARLVLEDDCLIGVEVCCAYLPSSMESTLYPGRTE